MKRVWSDWVYVIHDYDCQVPIAAFVSAYAAVKFFKKFSDMTNHYPSVHRYRCRLDDSMSQEKEDLTFRWIDHFEEAPKPRHSYRTDGLPF